jgi:hypothetical protein
MQVFVFFAIFLVVFVVKSSEPGLSRLRDFRMVAATNCLNRD